MAIRDADYAVGWVRDGGPAKETATERIRRRQGDCLRNEHLHGAEDQAQPLEDRRQKHQARAVGELDSGRESAKMIT